MPAKDLKFGADARSRLKRALDILYARKINTYTEFFRKVIL